MYCITLAYSETNYFFRYEMDDSKVEKVENFMKKNSNGDANETIANSTKSHSVVNPITRVKQDNLRNTKSSPHRNVELHHTRSFSEIFHLHPSHTDVSSITTYPKPRAITDLQHEVRRPESVLELSDLPMSSDEESDEDVTTTQRRGDEAMKIFLESNVSVPLDGNMSSSSLSQDTLDSDIASESELVVGNWEREIRGMLLNYTGDVAFILGSSDTNYGCLMSKL